MNAPLPTAALLPDAALQHRMADAVRLLAADAVERAASGHPGAPLGMAEMAVALWSRHLRHNPADPQWADRDRFVLSNGHASMLLYALLHLSGYALPMSELQRFRQLHSKTPGHPEVGLTPGVETTTGPLGQGLANAVGMALAEKLLAAEFNHPGHGLVDHRTWVFLGDGCLMEGVTQEAISLAGTLRLAKLIALYDDNGISIDGDVKGWFADDTPQRFRAHGWHVIGPIDGHDLGELDAALVQALQESRRSEGRPSLIVCRTIIGRGVPGKAGTADVHGAPLGAQALQALRQELQWPHGPFEIPANLSEAWDARTRGAAWQAEWTARLARYATAFPAQVPDFLRRMNRDLPADIEAGLDEVVARLAAQAKPVATRKASQQVLDAVAPLLPELLGGSADLTGSNLTDFKGCREAGPHAAGNYLHYGVREFGMAAMMNGIALHGGLLPYGGTFLTFSDYSRNAIRMAALMKQRVIHVFTHDSIGLGEDGPTHQPVEHLASLRLIPNLDVWRPADTAETAVAWSMAIRRRSGPSALVLSRQSLPVVATAGQREAIARGGYVLRPAAGPGVERAVLIATGSEVQLALAAQRQLADEGVAVRVVSMPSTTVFDRQAAAWREAVLPGHLPAVAVEAGHTDTWYKYVGLQGRIVGMHGFGESAPGPELMVHFGFTADGVIAAVRAVLGMLGVPAYTQLVPACPTAAEIPSGGGHR